MQFPLFQVDLSHGHFSGQRRLGLAEYPGGWGGLKMGLGENLMGGLKRGLYHMVPVLEGQWEGFVPRGTLLGLCLVGLVGGLVV